MRDCEWNVVNIIELNYWLFTLFIFAASLQISHPTPRMATNEILEISVQPKPSGNCYTRRTTYRSRRNQDDKSEEFSRSVMKKEALDFGDSDDSGGSSAQQKVFSTKRRSVKLVVWMVRILFLLSILTCLVVSKLTVLKILSELHIISAFYNSSYQYAPAAKEDQVLDVKRAVNLYWQLFLVVTIPNLLAWLRSLYYGILTKSHWPTNGAIIAVSVSIIIS